MRTIFVLLIVIAVTGCNYFSFTPRSSTNKYREMPTAQLYEKIVEFREIHGNWPVSRQDFISKDIKFYKALEGFKYRTVEFKIKDSDNMTFYFSDHIIDVEKEKATKKSELNAYGGHVVFYKENGKFLWKVKMN